MPKDCIKLVVENIGAEDVEAEGLLYVYEGWRLTPGFASTLIDEHYEKKGLALPNIIPVISVEEGLDDTYADDYLRVGGRWPAFVSGGRYLKGRLNRGMTHYDILRGDRLSRDNNFVVCFTRPNVLMKDFSEEMEAFHLTMGSVCVNSGILYVKSDLTKVDIPNIFG